MGKRFAANVVKMMSGTVLAMAINFLVTPVITRIYSPSDIGTFATITAIVGFFSGISSFRFGMATVIPKDDGDAMNVLALAGVALLGTTTVLSICLFLFGDLVTGYYSNVPELERWFWTVPIFVATIGVFQICRYWCSRPQMFGAISIAAVASSVAANGSKVGMGFQGFGVFGLVIGQLFGQLVPTIGFAIVTMRDVARRPKAITKKRMREMASTYKDFPRFHMPATFIHAAAKNLPNVGLGLFFSVQVVGWYSMAYLILNLPVYVASDAIRQVFYQRANEIFQKGGNVRREVVRLTALLFGLGLFPAIVFAMFAETILVFALGPEWGASGHFATLMTPYLFSVVFTIPCVTVLPVINKQKALLVWHILSLVGSVVAIWVGGTMGDATITIGLFSLSGTLLNIILIIYIYWALGRPIKSYGENT